MLKKLLTIVFAFIIVITLATIIMYITIAFWLVNIESISIEIRSQYYVPFFELIGVNSWFVILSFILYGIFFQASIFDNSLRRKAVLGFISGVLSTYIFNSIYLGFDYLDLLTILHLLIIGISCSLFPITFRLLSKKIDKINLE